MNATQLEALVIAAVDAVKAGANPEDDRIEFKREWPGVEKARQLAAASNQAAGEYIIYVIGVDDKTGAVHALDGTDPATWWPQMAAQFDEEAPELVRHIAVTVAPGERVVVLLFRTDRAPYLVKSAKAGGGLLEVPIRSGTMTRSAKRHELIRLLYPAAAVPRITTVTASLEQSPNFHHTGTPTINFALLAHLLFEPVTTKPVFLPWHAVTASLDFAGRQIKGKVHTYARENDSPSDAVHVRFDGIRVAEPGAISIQADWDFPLAQARKLRETDEWSIRVAFEVMGAQRQAEARMLLSDRRRAAYVDSGLIEDEDLHQWRWRLADGSQ